MATKIANPFVVGRYISAEYFCDRREETEFLKKSVENGRDVAIISPRRLGKSGLIEHFFASDFVRREYIPIFIDIYATSSQSELISLLGHAVFRAMLNEKKSYWRKFVESVKSLRPNISIDPISGQPSFGISAATITEPELTLNEIFTFLESAPRPCIIAIDEFQEISTYPEERTEALLRTLVQRCNSTRFIFAGSAESMMNNIFNSPKKPFYQSCLTLGLKPITLEEYTRFAMNLFADYGKQATPEIIAEVYNSMSGITWFVQMMMNELFAITPAGAVTDSASLPVAERNIIGVQEFSYRELMSRLSPRQRVLASFLAREGAVQNITSGSVLQASGFPSTASLQSALKGLRAHGLITTTGTHTALYDHFFARWLSTQPQY